MTQRNIRRLRGSTSRLGGLLGWPRRRIMDGPWSIPHESAGGRHEGPSRLPGVSGYVLVLQARPPVRLQAGRTASPGPAHRRLPPPPRVGEAARGSQPPAPHARGSPLGRLRLPGGDVDPGGIRPKRDRALPSRREEGRRRRAALHRTSRGIPRGRPPGPERGGAHAPRLPRRPPARPAQEAVHDEGVGRPGHDAVAPVGAHRSPAVRHHEHPVLARLPVRLRVLRHHGALSAACRAPSPPTR